MLAMRGYVRGKGGAKKLDGVVSNADARLCERLTELALQAGMAAGTMEVANSGGLRLKMVVEGHERRNLLGQLEWHDTLRVMAFDAGGGMLCNVTTLDGSMCTQKYSRGELKKAGRLRQEVGRAVAEMVDPQYRPEDYWSLGRMLEAKGVKESQAWLGRMQEPDEVKREIESEGCSL